MRKHTIKKQAVIFILCLATLPALGIASNKDKKLNDIVIKLRQLENKQRRDKQKQQDVNLNLKKVDLNINDIHVNIRQLAAKKKEKTNHLEQLQKDITTLTNTLSKQQKQFVKQLTIHYQLGQYPYLKLILNQQNPALTSRLMGYINYLNQARYLAINQLIQTKTSLNNKKTTLNHHIADIKLLTSEHHRQEGILIEQKKTQTMLVKQLNNKLSLRESKIIAVRKDRAQLIRILNNIKKKHFNLKNIHFEKMRKNLPWPTKGKLTNQFNREHDGIIYHGVIIKAHEGNNIRAICAGSVSFSGWLNGYGLILIINHGNGYMSLYANNQALYRQRGDIVAKGDVIASLGHSGGQLEDGLYFEIRHNGKPIPPVAWLK